MRYLLDSVILIDHFNGIAPATQFLSEYGADSCAVSVITRAEVLTGFEEKTETVVREFLDTFCAFPIDDETADLAARLRRRERWKVADALQAALAVRHELTLVTRNTRDFRPGGRLDVLVPYAL